MNIGIEDRLVQVNVRWCGFPITNKYPYKLQTCKFQGPIEIGKINQLEQMFNQMCIPSGKTAILAMKSTKDYASTVFIHGSEKHPLTIVRGRIVSHLSDSHVDVDIDLVSVTYTKNANILTSATSILQIGDWLYCNRQDCQPGSNTITYFQDSSKGVDSSGSILRKIGSPSDASEAVIGEGISLLDATQSNNTDNVLNIV